METKKTTDEMIRDYTIVYSITFSMLATLLFYVMYCINREPDCEMFISIMLISTTIGCLFGLASVADATLARSDEENQKYTKAVAVKHAAITLFLLVAIPVALIILSPAP